MDKPESGILLVLVIITGEKNRETQSNAGAGAVRWAAADTGRRQTPVGATHTGRQNACGYGGPLRAMDVEELLGPPVPVLYVVIVYRTIAYLSIMLA